MKKINWLEDLKKENTVKFEEVELIKYDENIIKELKILNETNRKFLEELKTIKFFLKEILKNVCN